MTNEDTALTCELTRLPPDGQVVVLLNVQHDLQAVSSAALQRGQQRVAIQAGVEGVTFSIARVNLWRKKREMEMH